MRTLTIVIVFGLIAIISACAPKATQKTITDPGIPVNDDVQQADAQPTADVSAPESPPAEQRSVASPAPAKPVEPAPAPKRVYTVRPGDTLWSIAARYYGDGQRYRDIINANPGLVPTKMYVGQQIILP